MSKVQRSSPASNAAPSTDAIKQATRQAMSMLRREYPRLSVEDREDCTHNALAYVAAQPSETYEARVTSKAHRSALDLLRARAREDVGSLHDAAEAEQPTGTSEAVQTRVAADVDAKADPYVDIQSRVYAEAEGALPTGWPARWMMVVADARTKCPACNGRRVDIHAGELQDTPCSRCGGSGIRVYVHVDPVDQERAQRRKTALARKKRRWEAAESTDHKLFGVHADVAVDVTTNGPASWRQRLVKAVCSIAVDDEAVPTARDLGLLALLAGDFPDIEIKPETTAAKVVAAMVETMRAVHRDIQPELVRPLRVAAPGRHEKRVVKVCAVFGRPSRSPTEFINRAERCGCEACTEALRHRRETMRYPKHRA